MAISLKVSKMKSEDNSCTVVVGAGIIGCATAFYLSRSKSVNPSTIHLVEASTELFASASGKAGGFLASDWFGPATASLGKLSFQLHRELAEEFDGHSNWGYSHSTSSSLLEGDQNDTHISQDWLQQGGSRVEAAAVHEFYGTNVGPAWLAKRPGNRMEVISGDESTAQVDPLRLSQFLLKQCEQNGVKLHQPAKVVRVLFDADHRISGVTLHNASGHDLEVPCSRILISAGAWTPKVFRALFPRSVLHIPIDSLAGYSIVLQSPRWKLEHESKGCHAVFTTTHQGFSPEIFSRLGEEIYIAGLNDPGMPLPELPTDAKMNSDSMAKLKRVAESFLTGHGTDSSDLIVLREGLCFRPVTPRGVPILDKVPNQHLDSGIGTKPDVASSVYIAAGHGPWGISHSLGTGKVMAEMLQGLKLSANVNGLSI